MKKHVSIDEVSRLRRFKGLFARAGHHSEIAALEVCKQL
jgi:hypothetical protein